MYLQINFRTLFLAFCILFTFCFSACNSVTVKEEPKTSTISFKAGLLYQMGVQPVARTKFYLLKKDIESLKNDKTVSGNIFLKPEIAASFARMGASGNFQEGIHEDTIKDFIVASTTSDFDGAGKFSNVTPGVYYLTGFTKTRSQYGYVIWSYKVDTEKDKETILLDPQNAYESEN